MSKIKKITREEIRKLCAATERLPEIQDQDEMAIPSYLHSNPLVRWVVWRRHVLIAELGEFGPGMDVLDFGCGSGIFLPTLCASGARVHAIDLFPEIAKKLCKSRQLNVWFHDDIDSIDDASLDVLVASEVLEHIETGLDRLLSTMHKKLKPGGRLLVSVPVEGRIYHLGRFMAGFSDKAEYHHHGGKEILRQIRNNEFIQCRTNAIPFKKFPVLYIVAEFQSDR